VFAWTQWGNAIWPVCAVLGVAAGLFAWVGITVKPETAPVVAEEVVS